MWRRIWRLCVNGKAPGRIRYLGITHYKASAFPEVEKILASEKLDFVQINYSLMEREAEERILPLAKERGVAVIINRPFGGGNLFERACAEKLPEWAAEFDCKSWAQFFLKWIIANPAVTCAIPATGNAVISKIICSAALADCLTRRCGSEWSSWYRNCRAPCVITVHRHRASHSANLLTATLRLRAEPQIRPRARRRP